MPSRAVLIRLRSLGDTVLMTPLLAVMRRLPDCKAAVLVEKPYNQILENNPCVDQLFVIDNEPGKWVARLQAIRQIRAFRPTLAIDLHGGTTSALITALSSAGKRVGYLGSRNSYCYNVKVPDSSQVWGRAHVHTVEHQMSILKCLGFPTEPIPPLSVPVAEEDIESAKKILSRESISEGFILIHPAAAFDTKQWDAEKFAELSRCLVDKGREVVITAGLGEEPLLRRIKEQCSHGVRIVSPQSISKFCALASLCSLYVGNDTGATHVAAALGKKIVVVFGSSDFSAWYPWNTQYQLIKSDLPCMPCPGYYCSEYDEPQCIRSIEVKRVFEAVQSML